MSKRVGHFLAFRTAPPQRGKLSSVFVLHVGHGHFDLRLARRLPWEHYKGRHAKARRTKDGWIAFIDCPPLFHGRLMWHRHPK